MKLGRSGVMGILVQGCAPDWTVLKVGDSEAHLEPIGDIIGLPNYSACEKLRERYGEDIGILIIGRAGEMGFANSTIAVTDVEGRPSRHCARGALAP